METELITDLTKRMDGALSAFHHDLSGLRTGRANPSLLESVVVEAYGDKMPINQLGSINVVDARMLSVQVWDGGLVKAVEKAITNANLGLNPTVDGQTVRVPIPDLTEDRRNEMVKIAAGYAEKARVALRNVRRDGMDKIKKAEKNNEISEDELHKIGDEIQKLTDQYVKQVDDDLALKEADITDV